jgi:hypothetical protein
MAVSGGKNGCEWWQKWLRVVAKNGCEWWQKRLRVVGKKGCWLAKKTVSGGKRLQVVGKMA